DRDARRVLADGAHAELNGPSGESQRDRLRPLLCCKRSPRHQGEPHCAVANSHPRASCHVPYVNVVFVALFSATGTISIAPSDDDATFIFLQSLGLAWSGTVWAWEGGLTRLPQEPSQEQVLCGSLCLHTDRSAFP